MCSTVTIHMYMYITLIIKYMLWKLQYMCIYTHMYIVSHSSVDFTCTCTCIIMIVAPCTAGLFREAKLSFLSRENLKILFVLILFLD